MQSNKLENSLNVGVVGMGLIGGSMARAYKADGHTVYGFDSNDTVTKFAVLCGALDGELNHGRYDELDLLFIATYPDAAIEYIRNNGALIGKDTVVIDLCGTKEKVCAAGFASAAEHGFTFVGGHPMAGTHNSGFKYSTSEMFRGAPMVIVPPTFDDIELLDRVKTLLSPAGFGTISVTTASSHDRMIAFTSQLAHVVSSAYIKSPTASEHRGFSAGSYRDMTRVAWLNPDMWTELFLENSDNLVRELDCVIGHLTEYRDSVARGNREELRQLLDDGRCRKEEVDGFGKNKS